MQVVLDVAVPVFAIIVAGYIGGRTVLGGGAAQALSLFVYWFALPAVLFVGMARQPLDSIFNWNYIGAFLGAMLVVYALGWLLGMLLHRQGQQIHAMQALNACFSNTGYMGIPLFLAAFGPDGVLPAIIATVIMSAIMVGVGVIALELVRNAGHGLGKALARVVTALIKNPLIIASVAGLAWNAAAIPMPKALTTFCDLLGAAAGPGALFAIGVFLAGRPFALGLRKVGWMAPLKLLVQPALTLVLIETVFPLDPFWTGSALLMAALPTGALTFVVAQQYHVYVEETSQIIVLSTVLSVPVISLLLMAYA